MRVDGFFPSVEKRELIENGAKTCRVAARVDYTAATIIAWKEILSSAAGARVMRQTKSILRMSFVFNSR
jgi:hypothetical protein